ncbi:hypothetical protein B0J12DRAFT_732031 [Macrophomina phaseolina]|uniref:Protein kinase domain-containing protein n=1 Tax=Macrophomina phaseolina TaxID=35725 RepID=A0ABQ8FXN0_9PEZI|nr:hypothetical protein B0J12DRAFT_732031 [Macrophomina phaseolina]
MDQNSIHEAFSRRPRPQAPSVPTHSSLLRQSLQTDTQTTITSPPPAHVSEKRSKGGSIEIIRKKTDITSTLHRDAYDDAIKGQDPWAYLTRLGTLTQRDLQLTVCISRSKPQNMRMVKAADDVKGSKEARMINTLRHPNIIRLFEAFRHESQVYLTLEYAPITLEEVVSVHLRLDESHMKLIACSRVVHGNVSLRSIRISEDSRLLLCKRASLAVDTSVKIHQLTSKASFDQVQERSGALPNTDFDGLGLALLQCMDGQVDRVKRDVEYVREQRALNKVFGLKEPEPWSGAKQLVDFLDELFNHEKSVDAKVEKPHEYVRGDDPRANLKHYVEMARLECFFLWRPE